MDLRTLTSCQAFKTSAYSHFFFDLFNHPGLLFDHITRWRVFLLNFFFFRLGILVFVKLFLLWLLLFFGDFVLHELRHASLYSLSGSFLTSGLIVAASFNRCGDCSLQIKELRAIFNFYSIDLLFLLVMQGRGLSQWATSCLLMSIYKSVCPEESLLNTVSVVLRLLRVTSLDCVYFRARAWTPFSLGSITDWWQLCIALLNHLFKQLVELGVLLFDHIDESLMALLESFLLIFDLHHCLSVCV